MYVILIHIMQSRTFLKLRSTSNFDSRTNFTKVKWIVLVIRVQDLVESRPLAQGHVLVEALSVLRVQNHDVGGNTHIYAYLSINNLLNHLYATCK